MTTKPDPVDWTKAYGFAGMGITVGKCAWCGDGFVALRLTSKPHIMCSQQCKRENNIDNKSRHRNKKS